MTLSRGLVAVMLELSRVAEPREACGLLLGRGLDVLFVADAPNTHDHPERHFRITPMHAAEIVRRAIALEVDVIGGWHSHPNGPPTLSRDDITGSPGDGFIQCVVVPGVESVRAWSVQPPSAVEMPVAFRR